MKLNNDFDTIHVHRVLDAERVHFIPHTDHLLFNCKNHLFHRLIISIIVLKIQANFWLLFFITVILTDLTIYYFQFFTIIINHN